MTKVLRWVGILFAGIGAVFTGIGILLLPARGPIFLIFTLAGLLIFAAGAGVLVYLAAHIRRRAQLLAEGICITADITDVAMYTRFRLNGRCPLVICCQAQNPEDGRVYVFRSEGFWYDPRPYLEDAGACTLPVYVDPNNYRHYAVDASGVLPEMG